MMPQPGCDASNHTSNEMENEMNTRPTQDIDVTTTRLPAVHLAVASAVSPSFDSTDVGPVIGLLYPRLMDALAAAGVKIVGPSIAYYDDTIDGGVRVHAGVPVDESVTEVPGLDVVDLPEVELAATAIHHGDTMTVDVDTVPHVFEWLREHGFRTTGYSRELYRHCPEDTAQWRTEMQFPIERDPGASSSSPVNGAATRIVSVSIRVADQDAAIGFFTGVLGFELTSDVEAWPGARWVELSLPDSEVTLVLLPPDSEIPVAVRLETPDARAAHRRVGDAGVALHNEQVLHLDGSPPMFHFSDPDGNDFVYLQSTRAPTKPDVST